ncbi:MAG TPA: cupredoxin domain-containing protein [Actinomycetota bacterium]|nr:cupredoxin domain-containing protein [Actinomycetota bacterium]
MRRIHRSIALAVVTGALTVACGGGGADVPTIASPESPSPTATATEEPSPTGSPVELEVEAEDFAFDSSTYSVPAGATVELTFKNRDEGVPHTFTIYETDAAEDQIFDTGNLVGDAEETYEFQAPEAGSYYFQCDVHPDMNGEFIAE